jgi:pantoate--beta-alanine ligase
LFLLIRAQELVETFTQASTLRRHLGELTRQGKRVALVPTMGNLHEGHLSLVDLANSHSDVVVATIFVNPLQFGPAEDLDAYPRTLERDLELLEGRGCHCVFTPAVDEIYGDSLDAQTIVKVPGVSEGYCGSSRPGHFEGVATVVTKLLNIVQPDVAVFGLKDYQQFLVIRKLVRDLQIPVEILGGEIVRESNGLALSSRNGYLDSQQREQASAIYRSLQSVAAELRKGSQAIRELESKGREIIEQAGLRPDYYAVCNAETLMPAQTHDENLVILAAAFLGSTRLIDNQRLTRNTHSTA